MLFLAVFCGFIAENIREHKIEKHRSEELAKSFYQELKDDSVAIHNVMVIRSRKDSALSYLLKYFKDSSINSGSRDFALNFSYGIVTLSPGLFEPKDAILEQLKNSGSLRYFKNLNLQKLTGQLSVAIADLKQRNEIETRYSLDRMIPFLIQHNDAGFYYRINPDGKFNLIQAMREFEKTGASITGIPGNARSMIDSVRS